MTTDEVRILQEAKSASEYNAEQIEELKRRVTKQEEKSEMLHQMSENIALIAQSLSQVKDDVGEVKDSQKELAQKVTTIENQPAKDTANRVANVKWNVISQIFTTLSGCLLVASAYIMITK